ncbi:MAG TPA: tyrosinase family protein, partial [Ferruginibacter sp.]|nr:tyrosinase family protein [Ferruginibacter sp.]
MNFILKINGSDSPKAAYVGWTPVKCTLSIEGNIADKPMKVVITVGHDGRKGRLSLYDGNKTSSSPIDKIEHDFQLQQELTFYVAGKFPNASVAEKDTFIQIESAGGEVPALTQKLMVRIRKNANGLDPQEIENFLRAFVQLNNLPPKESYSDNGYVAKPSQLLHEIVLMHTLDALFEIHRRTSFHPWHRAFLLHLERELQAVDPSVTVPYWKFDEAADRVFTSAFIGITKKSLNPNAGSTDTLRPTFDRTNPMYSYSDHTIWGGLTRAYAVSNPATGKPRPGIVEQDKILNGPDLFLSWSHFEETNSHNQGHLSFTGHIYNVGKDPVDPLFFMMHSNVDRLWALWQEKYKRFNNTEEAVYPFQDKYNGKRGKDWADANPGKFQPNSNFYSVDNTDIGNHADDSLWPWDLDH